MQIQQKLNNIPMKKVLILLLFLLSSHVLSSQENNLIPKKKVLVLLIIKPRIGVHYLLNDQLKIKTSIGNVKARGGELNSTSFSLGLNYTLSFLIAN